MRNLYYYLLLPIFLCGIMPTLAQATDLTSCYQQSQLTAPCIQTALTVGAIQMQQALTVQTKPLPQAIASPAPATNFLQVQSKTVPFTAGEAIQPQPTTSADTSNQSYPQNIFKTN